MIKISKDKITKVVTRGAYESFYKPLGYIISEDKKPMTSKIFNESVKNEDKEVNKLASAKSTKINEDKRK